MLQVGHDRLMFYEAHSCGEIVEEPRKAAVVEIDDAEPFSVDQEVCEAQIGMNQAEALALLTVSTHALGERIGDLLQQLSLGIAKSEPGAPVAPEWPCAQHGIKVPGLALEGECPLPRSAVPVQPGGQRAKFEEPGG